MFGVVFIWCHRSSTGRTTAAFVDCLNLPTFNRNLAQCRPYTKPIVTFTMASSSESRRARVWPMDGTLLGQVSLLRRQTILEVRKPKFGRAQVRFCVKNKCWRPEFGPELVAKYISELSSQQRYDICNQSSATFLPMLGQCWAIYNFALGLSLRRDQNLFKILLIFGAINVSQKDRNLTSFVIYFYKINILPSAWDH